MGQMAPPYYGKSRFWVKKRERTLKKIAKFQAVVKECEKELANYEKK